MNNLLLISAPGAGKGVVSKYLKEKYNYMHISMGNLLREKAKEDKNINEILKKGEFVDNNLVYSLIEEILINNRNTKFVFEGFPRTIEQNENFEKILSKHDIIIDRVIYIDTKKEIAEKRITGRLVCSNCNEIYNKYFDEIEDNKCKSCNHDLIKRNDDKLSTYKARYKTFIDKTIPLVEYYKEKNMVSVVSNNDSIENTYNQIDELMEEEMK